MRAPAAVFETNSVAVYQGHVLDVLREMPDESVDCVVTSPPYWGLRAYGTDFQLWGGTPACEHQWGVEQTKTVAIADKRERSHSSERDALMDGRPASQGAACHCGAWRGEYGLEPTPELYVEHTVAIFSEVRRVLRAHGTLWLNLGDSYAVSGKGGGGEKQQTNRGSGTGVRTRASARRDDAPVSTYRGTAAPGLKAKDLVGIPWRVAFALQADGWYLRSDIVWAKPNPMPESVTDRPTKSHEYVFLLSKSERYFFDQEAVRERGTTGSWEAMPPIGGVKQVGANGNNTYSGNTPPSDGRRNVRSVWNIATQPYPEAHFATFPRELPERCIKAGCPEQVCSTCGKARERIVERATGPTFAPLAIESSGALPDGRGTHRNLGARYQAHLDENPPKTVGFTDCGHDAYVPGTTLDPFAGSGTTLAVARDLGRRGVGIELNPDYVRLIEKRCAQLTLEASA